jgi:hypothetical protein
LKQIDETARQRRVGGPTMADNRSPEYLEVAVHEARIGVVYNMAPQPPSEKDTTWFPAGALTIGVEFRDVNPDDLLALYQDDPAQLKELLEKSPEGGFSDNGVSLHVRDTADGHEYLRFDCFDNEPHYHYIHNSTDPYVNNVVTFDPFACGELLPFAINCLRTRLRDMLPRAGAAELATRLDDAVINRVVDEVEVMAQRALDNARRLHAAAGS